MGPTVSWLWAMGITPDRLVSPRVGFIPAREVVDDGQTIEPSVSVPRAAAARFAAIAVPEPELDPHGLWSSTYGLRHCPARPVHPLDDWNERKLAHSDRLVFPNGTAPSLRRPRAVKASRGTTDPRRASDPAVVCIRSFVEMLSFSSMGIPWRGPRMWPSCLSLSSWSAMARASELISMTELSWIPVWSIWSIR